MAKISHSAWKKYLTCPKMYDFHYNHRLRPTGTTSALVFGTAIDEALNRMLLGAEGYLNTFQNHFKFSDEIEWDPRDLDEAIFSADQLQAIQGRTFEYKAWASMRVKGRMLLEAYEENILPNINKVYEVQKDLDGRRGVLDAIVDYGDYGKVLIDHKTAARAYKWDAVASSTQLALYASDQGLDTAGFIVLVKNINKNRVKICKKCGFDGSFSRHKTCPKMENSMRCHGQWDETTSPSAEIQVLIDKIPMTNKYIVQESLVETEKAIDAGLFPRNLDACGKMYGKPCPYIDKCWKNSNNGLVEVPSE